MLLWRFLSDTQSFDNSWSNSRFEIQRSKYTYSIWREQMMCAASVTFKICSISANKTLEQSRVSGVICSALFRHLCSESQSLFELTLDSCRQKCENTFTFIPAIYKQSWSALFKEKLLFRWQSAPKQKGNSRLVIATGVQPWNERAMLNGLSVWSLILRCHKRVGVPLLAIHGQ